MDTPKRKRLLLLAVGVALLCLALLLTGWAWYHASDISMALIGDPEVTVYYGEDYIDTGAEATYTCEWIPNKSVQLKTSMEGMPDTKILGDHYVQYTATFGLVRSTCYRLVRVLDKEAPVIELMSNSSACTLPNAEYEEEGFTAWDTCDGDLTHKVRRSVSQGYVTYTVEDSSGNSTTVKRRIRYNDPIAPELTIEGNQMLTLFTGQEYFEPGYVASDNVDGDISSWVQVSGGVDASTPGQYEILYTVSDSYNNKVTASRVVRVMPFNRDMDFSNAYVPNGNVIYLTFDDGPSAHTPRLLDILKRYNVKATFFVVNTNYIDTIKRAAAEGHTVAVHSASHKFKQIYASESAYFQDLELMRGIIEDLTGQCPTILRFPGGSSNTVSKFNRGIMTRLVKAVTEKGYDYFDWNVDSYDAGGAKTADEVFSNAVKGISKKNNAVVLQHDTKGFSVDAVERIILWGLVNGYRFEAITPESPTCHHNIKN